MKSLSRTGAVVAALFAGAAFGSMASGCVLAWVLEARADGPGYTTTTVPCVAADGGGTFAVQEYPGMSAAEIGARVTALDNTGSPAASALFPVTGAIVAPQVGDGFALRECLTALPGETVSFTIR